MSRARGGLSMLALAVGAVFVIFAAALVVGVGRAGPDMPASDETVADTADPASSGNPRRTSGSSTVPRGTADLFAVPSALVSAAAPYGTPAPMVGTLPSRGILDISASGFPPSVTGTVQQCGVA